ncbi:hypothetical protein QJS04_geneDACA000320 [Acorus gramineus]|uniref:Uncharacterized protein n=1 Tax=Acorus gramineus TaxID=55184 RepID=A0AAV9AQP7_ACOGR|nr:hypothetical protein QJS04_geneDACA000320 [Acorus gramineus]
MNPPTPPPIKPPPRCFPFATTRCKWKFYPLYHCSPRITTNFTRASLTYNRLVGPGSVYAGPAKCDGIKYSESELVVSISTGWFSKGSHCGKKILIKSNYGMSVVAKVVSECNSHGGCRRYFQPPCGNNVIEGTLSVYHALNLPVGSVQPVMWSFTNDLP